MFKFVYRLAVLSLISVPVMAGTIATPAGASTGFQIRVGHLRSLTVGPASKPNVNIVGQKKSATFSPDTVTVAVDTSGNDCNDSFVSLTMTNTGTKSAYVTLGGVHYLTLPSGDEAPLCAYGYAAGDKSTFGLTNKKKTKTFAATLTVTFSN